MMRLREQLREQLREHKIRAAGQPHRKFLPEGRLKQLLNFEDLLTIITDPAFKVPVHKHRFTTDIVLKEGRKLFSILLELHLEHALTAFIENDILDDALPVNENRLKDVIPNDTRRFLTHQWDYLAYSVRKGAYQRRVPAEAIMPYLEQTNIGGGGSSQVYRVVIHPDHQDIIQNPSEKGVCLVLKVITTTGTGRQPQNESEIGFLLGSLKHKNIVELLAAYSQAGISNLLFAPADSDLHEFLLQPHRTDGFQRKTSIFGALRGLASGLKYLHNFPFQIPSSSNSSVQVRHGCHQDIKPRNVLVQGNNFILADFGLSKLKAEYEDTKTTWKNATAEYGAPECQDPISFKPGRVGRASDIWSLGCILTEVMVYMENGAEGVEQFRIERLVDGIYGKTRYFHHNKALSAAVQTHLTGINAKNSSTALSRICSLMKLMLSIDPDNRPNAEAVENELAAVTIAALLENLLQLVSTCLEAPAILAGANVFCARLQLEYNQLRAWGVTLGLVPIKEHYRPSAWQSAAFWPELCSVLESAINELSTLRRLEPDSHNPHFVISLVHSTNNSLYNYLSDNERASMDTTFVLLSTNDADLQSLQQMEAISTGCFSQSYQEVKKVAALKAKSVRISQGSRNLTVSARLEPSSMQKGSDTEMPEVGPPTYWYNYGYRLTERKKVLIEKSGYSLTSASYVTNKVLEIFGEVTFSRIQELVAMLKHRPKPQHFRVLNCLGGFHDTNNQQVGIVYEFPSKEMVPVRLHWLLQSKPPQSVRPHPGQKLAIAKALLDSVHHFHLCGWLHKNISSYNILFFRRPSQRLNDLDFDSPYIVGFYHGRKDDPSEYTQGPHAENDHPEYQHPEYRTGRGVFKKNYEYYSLGLVLLEIGTWSCLMGIYDEFATTSPFVLKDKYIQWCDTRLLELMGPIYYGVVKRCLQITDDQLVGLEAILDFQRDVIHKLRMCVF